MAKKAFHCDGYYISCENRGKEDLADIRRDRQGFVKPHRLFCNTIGISSKLDLCRHCIENRKYFRNPPRKLNGRVKVRGSRMDYQVWNSE